MISTMRRWSGVTDKKEQKEQTELGESSAGQWLPRVQRVEKIKESTMLISLRLLLYLLLSERPGCSAWSESCPIYSSGRSLYNAHTQQTPVLTSSEYSEQQASSKNNVHMDNFKNCYPLRLNAVRKRNE